MSWRTTGGAFVLLLTILVSGFFLYSSNSISYEGESAAPVTKVVEQEAVVVPPKDLRPVVTHVPLPEAVRSIYMSACVVGTPDFRQRLVDFVLATEINSIIIDIKDYSGSVSFSPQSEEWRYAWETANCGARDMKEFIASLHEQGIFVIGRVTVFQDPLFTSRRPDLAVKRADGVTVWRDHKGLAFVDVGAKEYWDHIALLARESYEVGFDEINFDYVRYPSDGPMQDIAFTHASVSEHGTDKAANLEAFFAYLHSKLTDLEFFTSMRHEGTGREVALPYTSADLFGMTTSNTDDLSIGQVLERAVPYFDFIAPMVYPSHYPDSFLGLGNPNDYPYKIVNYAMNAGVERLAATTTSIASFTHERVGTSTPALYSKPVYPASALRTWIQDFDYGGDYDAADVRAQIQASYDAGVMGYMVWAPSNIYTKAAYITPE